MQSSSSQGREPGFGTGFARGPLTQAHMSAGTSSFSEFLSGHAPDLLPANGPSSAVADKIPHDTTIVALQFRGGVLIAGDRRATMGNLIAQRDIQKVFVTDSYSAVGIAGTAGIATEMVRLYTVELEHYEKIEGVSLSLDGKTNKLATMVRQNLEMAMAGLAVIPLFVGYDTEADDPDRGGRIVSYDVSGGRFEEHGGYHSVGSGSLFAKSSLKKLYDPDADADAALLTAVGALYDAADDDTATGGPDRIRGIYPNVVTITATDGAVRLTQDHVEEAAQTVLDERRTRGE